MLTQLQGKAGLLRQLGFVSATALVVSNMVGMGIFTTTGFMARDLGSAKLILACWLVGALFALAGALSYSELGINFPSSGGEYVYLTRAFGPAWGFMTGWVSFFAGFSAPIAAAALAFSDYLGYFYPSLQAGQRSHVFGSGHFGDPLGRRADGGLPADRGLQHSELPGGAAHGARAERADRHQTGGDHRLHRLGFLSGSGSWRHFSEPAVRTAPPPCPRSS
jgi:basic amino acid/polyamine antiporter, APA family